MDENSRTSCRRWETNFRPKRFRVHNLHHSANTQTKCVNKNLNTVVFFSFFFRVNIKQISEFLFSHTFFLFFQKYLLIF
uniref:Uncharacterized protein n=1 Tax=Octopus bimaculoides TaxID=37653 RepID=A0A0L8GYH7_OCTBM